MNKPWTKVLHAASMAAGLAFATCVSWAADPLPAPVQAKTEHYKKKLVEWAANPVIVAAVKEVNASGGLAGMSNGKWNDLDDKDPAVKAFETSKAGTLIRKWEEDKGINKLVLRDDKGNLVASSAKPLVYNNAARPVFVNAIKGQVWAASEIRPDPTTSIKSVQAGAPVMDGGKVIGVIHVGITTD
jgi:hypothetical protein